MAVDEDDISVQTFFISKIPDYFSYPEKRRFFVYSALCSTSLDRQILEGPHTYKSESICYNEHRGDPEASKKRKGTTTRPRKNAKKWKTKETQDTYSTIL